MSREKYRSLLWMIFSVALLPGLVRAQAGSPGQQSTAQPGTNGVPQSAPQNLQAISQTGLLPLFAVDMKIDPAWVDGNDMPSKSAQFSHSGVSDTFQQSWDALKAGGFNMLRFPVEVKDSQAAARVANLCIWA